MKVGGVVDCGWEDAFVLLAFALAVKLFPPFAEVVEFWIVVHQNLRLLAFGIECVAGLGVEVGGVAVVGCRGGCLHCLCSVEKGADVEACNGDRQKAYRCENGEASADVVLNYVGCVAFLCGERAERAALGVGDCNDVFRGKLLAFLCLKHFLEDAECDCRLGRCA